MNTGFLMFYWLFLVLLFIICRPIIKLNKADESTWTAKEILDATLEKLKISNKVVYNDEFINDYIDKNSGDLHLNNKVANSKNLICVSKVYQLIIDTNENVKRHLLDYYSVSIPLIIVLWIFVSIFFETDGVVRIIAYVLAIIPVYIIYYIFSKGRKRNLIYKNHINTLLASTNFTEKQKNVIQYLVYHKATLELYKIIYLIFSKK
jgi:hypothetical protein